MEFAVINRSKIDIFANSYIKSEKVDEALYGSKVKIIECVDSEWNYIETEYKYKGYVQSKYLLFNKNIIGEWRKNSIVINNFCDILDTPNIQSNIILTVPRGGYLEKNDKNIDGLWTSIKLVDGNTGWVKSSFLREIDNKAYNLKEIETYLRNQLVSDALLYLGTQYRWGGKTPEGIDCSGLCSMIYMLNNIIIYRDAEIKDGFMIKKIKRKYLNKGDLIYFPRHVAMYIGNDKYIHSSNINNIVRVNSLNINDDDYREDLAKSIIYVGSIF